MTSVEQIDIHILQIMPRPEGVPEIPFIKFLRTQFTQSEQTVEREFQYKLVDDPELAEFCILPHSWDQYVRSGLKHQIIQLAKSLENYGVHIVIWTGGDLESVIPISNVVQCETGLHRTIKRKPRFAFELPAFRSDYLKTYFCGERQYRNKKQRPVIGFCGQGTSTTYKLAYIAAKNIAHRLSFQFKASKYVPPPIVPSTILRNNVLKTLSQSQHVDTDFVIRDRYRAGLRSDKERFDEFHPTKVEFVNNIVETDYTVCVRGGGNFSVRLYETLSCGRIPIFVDTDSRLPFDFLLDWKNYCIWIEKSEIKHIDELVRDFHEDLSEDDFMELQDNCRSLWENWLSRDAFLSNFYRHLLFVRQHNS